MSTESSGVEDPFVEENDRSTEEDPNATSTLEFANVIGTGVVITRRRRQDASQVCLQREFASALALEEQFRHWRWARQPQHPCLVPCSLK